MAKKFPSALPPAQGRGRAGGRFIKTHCSRARGADRDGQHHPPSLEEGNALRTCLPDDLGGRESKWGLVQVQCRLGWPVMAAGMAGLLRPLCVTIVEQQNYRYYI